MPEIDEERESIKKAIEAAFADSRFPGSRPEDLVQYTIPPERERLAPLFAGKRWEDWKSRPMEMFDPHKFSGGLLFLEPEAFRYYLPVFLLAGLLQRKESANLLDEVVSNLIRRDSDGGAVWYSIAIGEMTESQLRATLQALDYFDKYHAPHAPWFHKEIAQARFSISHHLPPHDKLG